MDLAKYGKEKRYDRYPELLDVYVERMLEAHRLAARFFRDSELFRSGLIQHEDFLGIETAREISAEIMDSTIKDGLKVPTLLINRPKDNPSVRARGPIWEVINGFYNEGNEAPKLFDDRTYVQHIVNEPDDEDVQKTFHSDTFFPCVKFWYFPHAVGVEDGPFWYVPYSAVLTENIIDWYRERAADLKAGRVEEWRGVDHKEGSFRISTDEIEALGLKATPVCVKADTLVVANVFGFHRRGDVKEKKHRVSIHGSIRLDPFI